jgi:hypothetical protein
MRTVEMINGIHTVCISVANLRLSYHRLRHVAKLGGSVAREYAVKKR